MAAAPTRLGAARVLRPDGSLRPGVVVIAGGRIERVDDISGAGLPERTIAPGLIDLQVNGYGALDVASGSESDLDLLDRNLALAGTTSWCPTLTSRPLDWYEQWFLAHPDAPGGEIGVHLEGPFISRAGAHDPEVLRPPELEWLAGLPPRVRLVTLAPELPGALEAIEMLRDRAVVALGHSGASYERAVAAARQGAVLVTHVFNAMEPLRHRAPGLVGAALARDGLIPAVIGDGRHVHPSVLRLVLASGPAVLVSDSVAFDRYGLSVSGGAARLADGTIAGSVITLADAVRISVDAGMALAPVLVAATAAPARVMGRPDLGVIEAGARADLVALGPGLEIVGVWRAGRELAGQ